MADLDDPLIRRSQVRVGMRTNDGDDVDRNILTVVLRRIPKLEHDRRIITAAGPEDAVGFADAIMAALSK